MMDNLFIMFDPSTNILSMNWMILLMPLFFIPKKFYLLANRTNYTKMLIMMKVKNDFKNNVSKEKFSNLIIFMAIFTFIYMINMISIMPFTFTATSHMSTTLTLSLPLWTTMMMKGMKKTPNKMLIHMVPMSTPNILIPFMVLIESISSLIRPATLAIRLTANMISGHILISLLSSTLDKNIIIFISMSNVLLILILLEMAVCIIQAYVFIILLSLYLNEM